MTDDLSTRLLKAIELREQHAKKDIWAADQATQGNWQPRYGTNLPASWIQTETAPVAKLDGPQHEADALLIGRFRPRNVRERAEHMLRLCQAHREIVELHMVCQADYGVASERLANHPGWTEGLSQPTDLEAAVATAFARLQVSEHYLEIIAHGYGIDFDHPSGSPREGE